LLFGLIVRPAGSFNTLDEDACIIPVIAFVDLSMASDARWCEGLPGKLFTLMHAKATWFPVRREML